MYPETKGRTIEEVAVLFDLDRAGRGRSTDQESAIVDRPVAEQDSVNGDGEKGEDVQRENKGGREGYER